MRVDGDKGDEIFFNSNFRQCSSIKKERKEEGGKEGGRKERRKKGIKEQISFRNIRNLEMMETGIHNSQEKIMTLQMPSRYVTL